MLYDNLSDNEKRNLINKLYTKEHKSFSDIAEIYGTYANKIRRDAIKFDINIRNKSDAQKNALKYGKAEHPTKGKTRSEQTKNKIGAGVLESWSSMSEKELKDRKQKAKDQWDSMSKDEQALILNMANQAVRNSSKIGSKLERHLLQRLVDDGFKVDFHKEQVLSNTKLQIDLFLPSINTAIEVDGPSHFLPVWGEDSLKRNKKYDNKKQGLIVGKGWKLIRIKQTKEFSKTRGDIVFTKLKNILDTITNSTESSFIIEDN